MAPVRIYLAPGMFGFARLAAYDYFEHLQSALSKRFRARGRQAEIRVVEVHPTSSIRRRAAKLAQMLAHTAGTDDGPIHILGHSTGGLDARLVASPTAQLTHQSSPERRWLGRLRSITTLNTPHYGTPLASFFATAKGQQLLYAVSAITVTALKLGAPPLATASALVAALGRTGDSVGFEVALVDPEAMDLFHAGVEDRQSVRYHCVASYAPPSGLRDWIQTIRSPWAVVSAALFHLMYRVTAEQDERYPCAAPVGTEGLLRDVLGEVPDPGANDGVVPLSSQLWGKPLWIGKGDHLDLVGHFPGPGGHNDWLASGARFDIVRFETVMDRVFEGMLAAEG
ncbi:MAG: hypothetical protein JRI68_18220 [Deltaproteobacteria bacterium]|nr:hypothetical protein [Deltaproteobacteria bacterium]